jgi:hypothetical protein
MEGVVILVVIGAALWVLVDAGHRINLRRLDERRVEAARAEGRTTKTCPECRSEVPLEARRCAQCGSRFL